MSHWDSPPTLGLPAATTGIVALVPPPRLAAAIAVLTALVACRAPGGHAERPGSRPARLGRPAEPLPAPVAVASTATTNKVATTTTTGSTPARPAASTTTTSIGSLAARTVGSTADPSGDAGLLTPSYVDLTNVTIQSVGADARFVVQLASAPPDPPPPTETIGVGIDIYLGGGAESDYQLFADGSSPQWTAYLQGPKGFVDYPGTFRIGGGQLVFEVPWSAFGDIRAGTFSAFVDWTQDQPVGPPRAGHDRAPDTGRAALAR
jgi:hypothetical protein